MTYYPVSPRHLKDFARAFCEVREVHPHLDNVDVMQFSYCMSLQEHYPPLVGTGNRMPPALACQLDPIADRLDVVIK